jgi:DNA modification methylase
MIVGPENLPGRAVLHCGDCLVVLPTIATASVDSIVTDPPYGLEFMGKEWDTFTGAGMSKPGII